MVILNPQSGRSDFKRHTPSDKTRLDVTSAMKELAVCSLLEQ